MKLQPRWPLAYAAILLSAATIFSMSGIQSAQRSGMDRAGRALSTVRLARIDLNRGYLRAAAAGASPEERGEGLAILRQAGQMIAEAAREYAGAGVSGGGSETRSAFEAAAAVFEDFMKEVEQGKSSAELRIAFFGLERRTEYLDEAIQGDLRGFLQGLDARYLAALWLASAILVSIAAATHAAARSKARVEASLRESRELVRSIIENASSMIYAFDRDGRCILANRETAGFLGTDVESMIGRRRVDWLAPDAERAHSLNDAAVFESGEPATFEESASVPGGERVFLTTKFPIFGPDGEARAVVGISADISDRKRAERRLEASLAEREVLLRELNHRTKNNMQVISSWLALQSARTGNPEVVAALREADARIKAMALVHRKLYQGGDLSSIDLADYLGELLDILLAAYGDDGLRTAKELRLEKLETVIDVAVPCGLIASELVSNTMKHAFAGGRRGKISLELRRSPGGSVILDYSDDGPGAPGASPEADAKGIGLATVRAIGEGQLGGRVSIGFEGGFSFRLEFDDGGFRRRV